MRVLFCAAECSPWAKVGGLADVVGSLPLALGERGHDVRVCLPAYGLLKEFLGEPVAQIEVPLNPWCTHTAQIWTAEAEGLQIVAIDADDIFSSIRHSTEIYQRGRDEYLFFSLASLLACEAQGWMPDVVHAHDWHMGFIPVFMRERMGEAWAKVASVYTIHNIAYQGEFGEDTLDAAGLSRDLFTSDRLEFFDGINFLKAACMEADMTNTVSPTYAKEITSEEYGYRLYGVMEWLAKESRLVGILNGIDTVRHDPATDKALPANFTYEDLSGKQTCRTSLLQELGLDLGNDQPLMSLITRLSPQKGFHMLFEAMDRALALGTGLAVLGIGDPWAARKLRELEAAHPGKVKFVEAYDADLAQRIYGGSDIFLMPSVFEPCGLGQMFAMRYGVVPIARKTGGLADTVFENLNGFVFEEPSGDELYAAIERCVPAFRSPETWNRLMQVGMKTDWSWSGRSGDYEGLYRHAIDSRG